MPPRLPFVIGILAWFFVECAHGRASTRVSQVRLPVPTSDTIPYVAEAMGAASYEESVEEGSGEVKRVQRKLTGLEHKEQDLDHDELTEYQGVIGRPGVDFPVLPSIPRTDFNCRKVKSSGYYADLDTGCQVFHICDGGRKISFLCPNGTIFRQSHLICDWWFRVDCERSVEQYEESAEQLAHDQMIYKKRAEEIAKAMQSKLVTKENMKIPVNFSFNQEQLQPQQKRQQFQTQKPKKEQQQQFQPQQQQQQKFQPQQQQQQQFQPQQQQQQKFQPQQQQQQQFQPQQQQQQQFQPQQQHFKPHQQQQFQPQQQKQQFQPQQQQQQKLQQYQQQQKTQQQQEHQHFQQQQQLQERLRTTPKPLPQELEPDQQVEHEHQVPAESASFVNNKHRFSNQLENQYRNIATSNTPPSYINEQAGFNYNPHESQNANDNLQYSTSFDNGFPTTYSDSDNYPTTINDNNNYPSTNNANANYQSTIQNSYTSTTTVSFPTSNNYPPSSTSNNYPASSSSNYPSSSTRNNYPSSSTNNNYPSSSTNNNYPSSSTINNYQSTTPSDLRSNYRLSTLAPSNNFNKNYNKNRGKVNYFNSDSYVNGDDQYFTDSPDDEFSTPGSTFTSTSQKYVEHLGSEIQAASGQGKLSKNEYLPLASTTVRTVTSRINSLTDHTPRVEKYAGLKQKPIFNVKIKPTKDTKDIAYVELLRQEERNVQNIAPNLSDYSSPSSSTYDHGDIPVSKFVTTPTPSTVTESKSRNTYLPKHINEKKENTKSQPTKNRYASISVSGTTQEIRPEIVNALMENGVTPTSAKALHSLASYISSGAVEEDYANVYNDGSHPHVSDVILNFRSGSPIVTRKEGTTNTPLTSSGEALPSVLTNATKESYSYLFSDGNEKIDLMKEEPKYQLNIDVTTPKPRSTTTTKAPQTTTANKQDDLRLKDSSELRELAQVFSRALSAYLEDPETFKEILAQVRPTEPNVDNTTPSNDDEVLDFSDAMLGRLGTTVPPVTLSDYVDDNLNIGEINSLNSGKSYEQDNSLEHNTFPPTAPEALQDSQYTSATPKLLYFNPRNNTQRINYFAKLGSAEDQSYFPTAGGVRDNSRPRYGGFQNNTNKKPYSPYGSDIPKNITGVPISSPQPSTSPKTASYTKNTNSSTFQQSIPEPYDVNSFIKSNILNSEQVSSEDSYDSYQTSPSFLQEEAYYSPGDQEKVLVASGSQSLVSSNNYVQFAKNFNEQQVQEGKKQQERFYKISQQGNQGSSTTPVPVIVADDLSPYFGQEPPLEILAQPSGFRTQGSDSGANNGRSNKNNPDPVNYHIGLANDKLASSSPRVVSSQSYEVSYGSSSVGSSLPVTGSSSWTVSPMFDVTSSGTSVHFNYTKKPESPTKLTSNKYHPTTYHPPHSKESLEIKDEGETTVQTESRQSDETTPSYDSSAAGTTLSADEQYKNFEKSAKEMFGMLNETAAITLMNMMAMGETNMTIRRLVLLLVNNKGKENITAQESRESLINALLLNADESMTSTPTQRSTAAPSTTQATRKKVRVSRVRVSPPKKESSVTNKSYRGTDSMTAVHGSIPSPSDLNKINAAKLYIPTPSAAALTSNRLPIDSDARAVELLKTLYSLAAKWG